MRPGGASVSPPSPTLGRGRVQRIWLGFFLALGLLTSFVSHTTAQDLAAANRDLSDLEADARRLMADPVRPLDLKSETLSLAIMAELPLVVVNIQRAGPSTGMPTKTEQADLLQALFGRFCEAPCLVLAARSPSDCFDPTRHPCRRPSE